MNILDIIKNRRSVRDFKDQEISEIAIDVLIKALRWAPGVEPAKQAALFCLE